MMFRIKHYILIVLLTLAPAVIGQVTSFSDGDYSSNLSWIGNAPNSVTDDVLILHDLILDVNITIEKDFEIQGSLIGTAGKSIKVKSNGFLTIGSLNIDDDLDVEDNGEVLIKAGDTVYVKNLKLSDNAIVIVESNAVLYVEKDVELKNSANLTVLSGAEIHVGDDFKLKDNATALIDGSIFVTDKLETKNNATITGTGSISVGTESKIKNNSSVFGSTTPCNGCVYSNGCLFNSVENEWTGLINSDWFNPLNWTAAVPNQLSQVRIVSAINSPVISGTGATCFHLTIEQGAVLEISDFDSLSIMGDAVFNGDFISNSSILNFNSNCWGSSLSASDTVRINSLVINNFNSASIISGHFEMTGSLHLLNGDFSTNDSLVLISDATGTARIGEISPGSLIVGEIEMQRYIDAGETYWRFFSSAVENATVGDYQGDFITSGYVGSDFPNFPFTSVYTYTEGTGYVAVSNASQIINQGEGFMVWSGDTITGTDPFVVDYRGVPNQGDINMPVSFTNTDGWNLVGNPYASTIDWDSPDWDKTNLANAVYILNPDTEQYATYINGASANGGSNLIASQQAFWVGAIAANPILTAKESVKSSVDQAFFKAGSAISSGVHILLSGNGMTDEAVLRHVDGATVGYESDYDATKKFASWMEYPHVSLINEDGVDFTVHSFDKAFQEWSMPLRAIVFQNGVYNIVFNDIHELNVPCLKLEDTYSGLVYIIEEGVPLSFNMSDTTYAPRFILHIGKTYDISITNALCTGEQGNVTILIDSTETGFYELQSIDSLYSGSYSGAVTIGSLEAGNYSIELNGSANLCMINKQDFEITEPSPIIIQSVILPETAGQDGEIQLNIVGGTPNYSILWSNGGTNMLAKGLSAGNYTVTVTDANSCFEKGEFLLRSVLTVDESDFKTEFKYFANEDRIEISGYLDQEYSLVDLSGKSIKNYSVAKGLTKTNLIIPSTLSKGTYILTGFTNAITIIK